MVGLNFDLLITFLISGSIQILSVVLILFIAIKIKKIFDLKYIKDSKVILVEDALYYLAFTLIIFSSLYGESKTILIDIASIITISLIGVLFLSLNQIIIKKIQLKDIVKKQNSDNMAIAIIIGSNYIATSIIFFKNFYGYELSLNSIYISIYYFILTQFFMFITIELFILKTRYDDIKELERDNISVAIEQSSLLIALAILFSNVAKEAIIIDTTSTTLLITYFIISTTILIFLPHLITKLFIKDKNRSIEDLISQNSLEVAIKSAFIKILLATIFITILPFNIFIME
jgi:uncharacterized membrane protein YjfL (UPF0719 family)